MCRTGEVSASSPLCNNWWADVLRSEDKHCEAACVFQHITCRLLQRAARIRSAAPTSRPTTATHVSARLSPDCMVSVVSSTPMLFVCASLPFSVWFAADYFMLWVWTCVLMWHSVYFCCWASLRDFKCFIAPFFAPLFCVCFVFVYFSFGNKIMWSCRVRSILSSFCSDLSFCPSAGIPKTQSLNSTTSSLKRPPASTSLPAAPTMPGTSMTRRTRISWGSLPPLHPCHQAHIQHLHRTR